jgi:hypothetical protein
MSFVSHSLLLLQWLYQSCNWTSSRATLVNLWRHLIEMFEFHMLIKSILTMHFLFILHFFIVKYELNDFFVTLANACEMKTIILLKELTKVYIVLPLWSLYSVSAPFLSRISHISYYCLLMAKKIGVLPCSSLVLITVLFETIEVIYSSCFIRP